MNRSTMNPLALRTFAVAGMVLLILRSASAEETEKPIYALAWKRLLGGSVPLPAVGSDRTVYVGSKEGDLYALRASDGRTLWRYSTGAEVRATPRPTGDFVLVGGGNGVFHALDRRSGKMRWTFRTRGRIVAGASVSGDTTFFGSGDGTIYALRVRTGELVWKARVSAEIIASPGVDARSVYFGTGDGTFWALAKDTGFRRWTFETHGPIRTRPAVRRTGVYFGSDDGYVYALDPEDGGLRWKYRAGAGIRSLTIIPSDRIVFGAENGYLYALNVETGELRWKHKFRARVVGIAPSPDGLVTVGTEDGFLYRTDASSGETRRVLGPLPSAVRPRGSDGAVYLAGEDGHLYAMRRLSSYRTNPGALWETWSEAFYAGIKVGYSHEWAEREREILRVHTEETNWDGGFRRTTSTVEVDTSWGLLSFDERRVEDDQILSVRGRRIGNSVFLDKELAGYRLRDTVQVSEPPVPVELLERALFARTRPIPGRTYTVDAFDTWALTPENVSVTVVGPDTLDIRDRRRPAILLTVRHDLNELRDIETREWVNPEGQILYAEMPELRLNSRVASWTEALSWNGIEAQDTLKISVPIRPHENVEALEIRVEVKTGRVDRLFVRDHRQEVHPESARSARIEIRRENSKFEIRISNFEFRNPKSTSSLPEEIRLYLRPTVYLQSDDPRIVALAERIVGKERNAARATMRILEWVYNHMIGIERNVKFKSALEVLETMEGTCSEHTVLFLALARAAGIPARACVGLLPVSGTDLGLHMWAQVYVGRWVDVDPSWNQMPVDASHIKIAQGDVSLEDMLRLNMPLHLARTQLDTVRVIRYRAGSEWVLTRAEKLFEEAARADRNFDELAALDLLRKVTELPPNARTDDALLRIAQLHLQRDEVEDAARALRQILTAYPRSDSADDALFAWAKLQAERLSAPDSAVATLAALVDRFPDSGLADDALCRMAEIYEKDLDNLPAAEEAYRKVIEHYPGTGWAIIAEEALERYARTKQK